MNEKQRNVLLEATGCIREEYIEEAAGSQRTRPRWVGFSAIAALLAIFLGMVAWLLPAAPANASVPFFAIRAYAQDGTVSTLDCAGDNTALRTGENDLFPGKHTYTLDVSLESALQQSEVLENCDFELRHNGNILEPGQSDEKLSIEWHEEEGFYGYRIIGWCADFDLFSIMLRNSDGLILHEKSLRINFDGQYSTVVYTSYTYEAGLSTEQLLEKLFDSGQYYLHKTSIASTPNVEYGILRDQCGGFAELEQRPDAAGLLLERWVQEMEKPKEDRSQHWGHYWLLLSQDVYWQQLTRKERAQFESYGFSRWTGESAGSFDEEHTFHYKLLLEDAERNGHRLTISYGGKVCDDKDDHILTRFIYSTDEEPDLRFIGWYISGWFDEPTELTLTVADTDGIPVRQQILLIAPTDTGYDITLLQETP